MVEVPWGLEGCCVVGAAAAAAAGVCEAVCAAVEERRGVWS